jgi:ATP-dependent protease ClpP protease subunit
LAIHGDLRLRLTIKVACALAAIAILGIWLSNRHSGTSDVVCDTLTLTGEIKPKIFFDAQDCLVRSKAKEKTFVITESIGGDWEAALAMGILIHRHGWNVEVVDLCASSCANFIFPAGKKKYLHADAMLLYHGGPHQKNMSEKYRAAEQAYMAHYASANSSSSATNSTSAADAAASPLHDPRARIEGSITFDDQGTLRLKVREFLGVRDVSSADDLFAKLVAASDRFYEELGVNLLLPHYGQIGQYEPKYEAGEWGGFIYRLDSLAKLGVGNIDVKGGEWQPERHRDYTDVYEVTYP